MAAHDSLGPQFHSEYQQVDKDFSSTGHGVLHRGEMVPRHNETGEPPKTLFRWAHHEAVKGYLSNGVPSGTHFALEASDDRYRASDHELISVPYSDALFRSSESSTGTLYAATTSTVPPQQVRQHK